jgi:hypothetical protein
MLLGSSVDRTAMTIGDQVISVGVEVTIVLAFGIVMLGIAARVGCGRNDDQPADENRKNH